MTATETSTARFDPIELEILWQSLISTVNEQARALQRAAFSPIVREAGDLANAVFDRRGRMVAQAVTGTPGHINSLAIGAASMLEVPGRDAPAGRCFDHQRPLQDCRAATRRDGVGPGMAKRASDRLGSTIHHTDVGGYGIGAGGRDVFEEGLWIPICRLMRRQRRQRSKRRRLAFHPVECAAARSHGRGPSRPDGVG